MSDEFNRSSVPKAVQDEMDRVLDIAVADENTRLANGGPGIGDKPAAVKYDGGYYDFRRDDEEQIRAPDLSKLTETYRGERQPPQTTAQLETHMEYVAQKVLFIGDPQLRVSIGFLLDHIRRMETSGRSL